MILETTYTSKAIKQQIDQAVGRPFSLIERLKMGGNGSKRMRILEVSEAYKSFLRAAHYTIYSNLELRPKGILIHFRFKLESFVWVMPFNSLNIEGGKNLRLESEGKFIVFKDGVLINSSFLKKLETYLKS